MHADIERPHSERIARQDETVAIRIPQRNGPLTVEATKRIGAPLFVGMDDDFRIATRAEPVSPFLEIVSQFDVVEDLSVERNPE